MPGYSDLILLCNFMFGIMESGVVFLKAMESGAMNNKSLMEERSSSLWRKVGSEEMITLTYVRVIESKMAETISHDVNSDKFIYTFLVRTSCILALLGSLC